MKIQAPAKINLYLKVHFKRSDGYHELTTIMMPVGLYDEIELEKTPHGIDLHAPGCDCTTEDNLAYKSARLFFETTGINAGIAIRLEKHIPSGAGLGGGSSDAAHVLKGLNSIFQTNLARETLADMAARLGADCPFFIYGEPAYMGSRGDVFLSKVHLYPRKYLIAIPPFGISTQNVYRNLKIPLTQHPEIINIENIKKNEIAPEDILMNALEASAFEIRPEIKQIKQDLIDAGALGALMSGSGSAIFGVFASEHTLHEGLGHLKRRDGYAYIPTT